MTAQEARDKLGKYRDILRTRLKDVSPGPWRWDYSMGWYALQDKDGETVMDDGSACSEYSREIEPESQDGRFIPFARETVPALLAIIAAGLKCQEKEQGYQDWCDTAMACEEWRRGYEQAQWEVSDRFIIKCAESLAPHFGEVVG